MRTGVVTVNGRETIYVCSVDIPTWRNGRRGDIMIKVHGPYLRKDGRKHVVLYDMETQSKKTVSYPKYLMENHLGRKLLPNEEVDHIDEDFTNDSLDNLQVLTKAEHNLKSMLSRKKEEYFKLNCIRCKNVFYRLVRDVKHNQDVQKKAGPFCGKSCAGSYGADVQNGRI